MPARLSAAASTAVLLVAGWLPVGARAVVPGVPAIYVDYEQLLTLQPSSSYGAAETATPSAPQKYFTTAATGTAGSPAQPSASGGAAGSSQDDIVGSALPRIQGTLVATVTASGKATLTRSGRAVARLHAGRFELVVDDKAPHARLFFERRGGKPMTVSSLVFVGKRSRVLTLSAGSWTYFSDAGKPVSFTVR